ncbi:MAG: hypothetical protein LUI14_14885 [Lachnospiraceae bacterium]|nr:hypothetical protein [Lachnospiraceae bacterium]
MRRNSQNACKDVGEYQIDRQQPENTPNPVSQTNQFREWYDDERIENGQAHEDERPAKCGIQEFFPEEKKYQNTNQIEKREFFDPAYGT